MENFSQNPIFGQNDRSQNADSDRPFCHRSKWNGPNDSNLFFSKWSSWRFLRYEFILYAFFSLKDQLVRTGPKMSLRVNKNFDFWQIFRFLTKISNFDKDFDFWRKFRLLTNILLSGFFVAQKILKMDARD